MPACKGGGDGMRPIPPCKDCPDRTAGERTTDCHTNCERYQAYRAAKIEEGRVRRRDALVTSTLVEGRRRMRDNPPSRLNQRDK